MTTYEQIAAANSTIKTTPIKGKEYAMVNERIKAFRMIYPTGQICTDMISDENGKAVFKATILDDKGVTLATGHAYEREQMSQINKTSYIENCETSAVGRALANCGFGIDVSVASAEEMTQALANQTISEITVKALTKYLEENGIRQETVFKLYKVEKLSDLTDAQHVNIHEHIKKIREAQDGEQG